MNLLVQCKSKSIPFVFVVVVVFQCFLCVSLFLSVQHCATVTILILRIFIFFCSKWKKTVDLIDGSLLHMTVLCSYRSLNCITYRTASYCMWSYPMNRILRSQTRVLMHKVEPMTWRSCMCYCSEQSDRLQPIWLNEFTSYFCASTSHCMKECSPNK